MGYRVANPCTGLPRPRQRPPRSAHLSRQQEKMLVESCAEGPPWLVWCVRLALETAIAQVKFDGLKWEHVHNTHVRLAEIKNSGT
jgi:hypothetical protein